MKIIQKINNKPVFYFFIFSLIISFVFIAFLSKELLGSVKSGGVAEASSVTVSSNDMTDAPKLDVFVVTRKGDDIRMHQELFSDNAFLWSIKGVWFSKIKLSIPKRFFGNISEIKIDIGKKSFLLNKEVLLGKVDNAVGSKVIVEIDSSFIDMPVSKYSLAENLINWPGDNKIAFSIILYSLDFLLPSIIFILIIFFVFYFKLFFISRDASINADNKKAKVEDIIIGAISIFAVTFLLFDLRSRFYLDWENHLWLIGYNGEYFKSNFSFANTLSVVQNVYSLENLFYGYLFYPFIGIVSAFVGPNIALRLLVIFLFIIQYYFCWKAIFLISKNRLIANTVSVLVTWSIYPLTNLYNRAAITEFVATLLAFISLSIFLIIIIEKKEKFNYKYLLYFSLALIFCLGTHPITAFYFSLFFLFAVVAFFSEFFSFLKKLSKPELASIFIALLLIFIVILPWGYIVLSEGSGLSISNDSDGVCLFSDSIDSLVNRFSPILPILDKRISQSSIKEVSSPYLDTQILVSVALLVLLLFALGCFRLKDNLRLNKSHIFSFVFLTVLFIFYTTLSLSSSIFKYLPKQFSIVQFNYRIVTYQSFLIFLIFVRILTLFGLKESMKKRIIISFSIVFVLSGFSLFIKLTHILPIRSVAHKSNSSFFYKIDPDSSDFFSYPDSFYGRGGYSDIMRIPEAFESELNDMRVISFELDKNKFCKVLPIAQADINMSGWYKTNIARHGWNKLYLDGKEIDNCFVKGTGAVLLFFLQKGVHSLEVKSVFPKTFILIRFCSFAVTIILLIFLFIYCIRNSFLDNRKFLAVLRSKIRK